jgi:hypothetical protein
MSKKLYGPAPDQVPTNADLGTMAYQDYDAFIDGNVVSRPNLFINGDFQVWQRSDNAYTGGNGYISVDRIRATRGRIRKPNTNGNSGEDDRGCILDVTDGSVYAHFDTFIEDVGQKLSGKRAVLTFEAKSAGASAEPGGWGLYMEDAGYTGFGGLDMGSSQTFTVVPTEWRKVVIYGTITYDGSGEYFRLPRWYVNPTGGSSTRMLQIDKLKVEIIESATDKPTPFASRSYGEELRDCQRYYIRRTIDSDNDYPGLCAGWLSVSGTQNFATQFEQPMRADPTMYASGNWRGQGKVDSGNSSSLSMYNESPVAARLALTSSAFSGTDGAVGVLQGKSTGGWLAFDADY